MEAFLGTKTSAMGDQNPWFLLLYNIGGLSLICLRIPKKRQWNVRKRDFVDVALSEEVGSLMIFELVG